MNAAHYSVSEAEIRRAIEEFSQDVRMASAIKWNSQTSITLTVPDNYSASINQVTYAWDSTTKTFYRKAGNAASTAAKTVYIREVTSFNYSRFNRQNNAAVSDASTKRIQITIAVTRTRSTLVAAATRLVTASYTLRNKVIN
jgi:hypothetical protein